MKHSLSDSIVNTLRYAHFFDFPLNLDELHHRLISDAPVSISKLKAALKRAPIPAPLQHFHTPIFKNIPSSKRIHRLKFTQNKMPSALRATRLLSLFPTIKLVALTGSMAVANAKSSHDIDFLIVTVPHTLWLTRLLVIPLATLFFPRRRPYQLTHFKNTLCFNLWLDTTSLTLPPQKQNLYTAHEVLQVKPLLNRHHTYQSFIKCNSWTKKYLANAYHSLSSSTPISTFSPLWRLLIPLNLIAFLLQYLYMRPKLTTESVSLHAAYFHPKDYFPQITRHLQ